MRNGKRNERCIEGDGNKGFKGMKRSQWTHHFNIADRSVVSLSSIASSLFLHSLPCPRSDPTQTPPHFSAGCTWFTSNPLSGETQKSRITAHLHAFVPVFFPPVESTSTFSSISFFLRQLFTTISDRLQSKTMIFSTPVNLHPSPPTSPSSSKFPVFSS